MKYTQRRICNICKSLINSNFQENLVLWYVNVESDYYIYYKKPTPNSLVLRLVDWYSDCWYAFVMNL